MTIIAHYFIQKFDALVTSTLCFFPVFQQQCCNRAGMHCSKPGCNSIYAGNSTKASNHPRRNGTGL